MPTKTTTAARKKTGRTAANPDVQPLDGNVELVKAYESAAAEADKWRETAEALKAQIKELLGEATTATLNGRAVFTYRHTGVFDERAFVIDNPDLAATYSREVTRREIDRVALEAEQPVLYARYRARRFVRKP
jgi:hypothetical protein